MKKQDQMKELAALTDMVFAATSAETQKLAARQTELKSALQVLRTDAAAGQQYLTEDVQLRMSQVDVLWQAWLGTQARVLNQELAQVSAQRARQMRDLRIAFGRKEAAAGLVGRKRGV
ncbi:hypothetical protein [Thalassovita sp.]|uniref:hypothetical protein n=1 Tax=Thalassovita sp. TaxID=1979401 RepID=UPI0029DE6350|nr:hypothetical protein [Thalassovita sp.]